MRGEVSLRGILIVLDLNCIGAALDDVLGRSVGVGARVRDVG